MKTFADVKRRAVTGARLTLTQHSYGHKALGVARAIEKTQTNAIKFEGGSWLYWPKAGEIRVTGPDTFDVCLAEDGSFSKFMSYRFE